MKNLLIAALCIAVPASVAFSNPAEAKRFRSSSSASKPAAKPEPKPATPSAAQPAAARGGSTLIIVPGIGSAHASTRPEEVERRKQLDAARQQEEAEAKKEAKRKADEAYRASLPPGHEIPRLGSMQAAENKPKLPGFGVLN